MKSQIEIISVRWVDKVLEVALEAQPLPLPDEEGAKEAAAAPVVEAPVKPGDGVESIKH